MWIFALGGKLPGTVLLPQEQGGGVRDLLLRMHAGWYGRMRVGAEGRMHACGERADGELPLAWELVRARLGETGSEVQW